MFMWRLCFSGTTITMLCSGKAEPVRSCLTGGKMQRYAQEPETIFLGQDGLNFASTEAQGRKRGGHLGSEDRSNGR